MTSPPSHNPKFPSNNVGLGSLTSLATNSGASVIRVPGGVTERAGEPGGVHGGPGGPPTGPPHSQQTKLKNPHGKKTKGRVKIKMEFIDNKLRRYTTFSKRKAGLMKKAYELSTLTGTEVMLLVASETGHVYTFATRKLQPMITSEAGKQLIQTCLNSPDLPSGSDGDSQQPVEHHMNLGGGFDESDLGTGDDFDDGDYTMEDDDSSNGSPPPAVGRLNSAPSNLLMDSVNNLGQFLPSDYINATPSSLGDYTSLSGSSYPGGGLHGGSNGLSSSSRSYEREDEVPTYFETAESSHR